MLKEICLEAWKGMVVALVIAIVTVVMLIADVLLLPSIRIGRKSVAVYPWIAVLGAVMLILTGRISIAEVWAGLTADSSVNPIKILVLFLSMSSMSIFLDEAGFFRFLAEKALLKAKTSQISLFFVLYATVSLLTVFTSNDIVVLTFTPFICYFCKNANISPTPYLFGEFVAANTWSMMLLIGNPTNIYLASSAGVSFVDYLAFMWLPTIACGLVTMGILLLIFKKPLKQKMTITADKPILKNKAFTVLGMVHLALCTILLVLSSYLNFEMWLITLAFALSLFLLTIIIKILRHDPTPILRNSFRRIPWELVPFVISMFVLVLTLEQFNVTGLIAEALETNAQMSNTFAYGLSSYLVCNVINNIPMSVLFSGIVGAGNAGLKCVYACIAGSNLGALLTPIGALAAIMWNSILKKHDVKFSYLDYIKYGALVSVPGLCAALLLIAIL